MQSQFSLYRSHTEAAQFFWMSHLKHHKGNIVDCTLGQGKDFLFLAKAVLEKSSALFTKESLIFGIDIQEQSLETTKVLLEKELSHEAFHNVKLLQTSHSDFDFVSAKPLTLVVYNLGYLPGSDKKVTTLRATTLISLQKAMSALCLGGMITITCYPGHEEGKDELFMLYDFLWKLPKSEFSVSHLQFAKEESLAPTLWIMQKRKSS